MKTVVDLASMIPAAARKAIYTVGLTVFAVEGVLDSEGVGLLPEKVESIVLGIYAVLGFGLARLNTRDVIVVREGDNA